MLRNHRSNLHPLDNPPFNVSFEKKRHENDFALHKNVTLRLVSSIAALFA